MESAAPGADCGTARELFDTLVREGEDVAVAAHCGGRYADIVYAHDGHMENSVEIHAITPVDESGDRRGVSLRRELAIGRSRDTRLYARVTRMDGHQAWSSPIYLVRDGGWPPRGRNPQPRARSSPAAQAVQAVQGRNLESCKVT